MVINDDGGDVVEDEFHQVRGEAKTGFSQLSLSQVFFFYHFLHHLIKVIKVVKVIKVIILTSIVIMCSTTAPLDRGSS